MTAQEDLKTPYDAHHEELRKAIAQAQTFDFRQAYELDRQLKASPELRAQFENDPRGTAKELVGLELPANFHIHFINEKNEYSPQSGDAVSHPLTQLQAGQGGKMWGRVEIRAAVGPGAIALSIGVPDPGGNNPEAIGVPDPGGTTPPVQHP